MLEPQQLEAQQDRMVETLSFQDATSRPVEAYLRTELRIATAVYELDRNVFPAATIRTPMKMRNQQWLSLLVLWLPCHPPSN